MSLILIYLGFTLSTEAQFLSWEAQKLTIETPSSNQKLERVFKYKNNTQQTIKFVKIKTSCGCVLIDSPKQVLPGDSGEVSFKAPVPKAGGAYRKSISVDTDESNSVEYNLTFYVKNTDKRLRAIVPVTSTPVVNKSIRRNEPSSQPQLYKRPKTMDSRLTLVEKLLAQQVLRKSKQYLKQDECPFLPLGIVTHLYHDWNGLRIYTCCEQCLILVKESPHHAIIKLAEKGQIPIKINTLK